MIETDKCPVCKSTEYATIGLSSSAEYASIICYQGGEITPRICLNCGTVYVSELDRKMIRRYHKKRKD